MLTPPLPEASAHLAGDWFAQGVQVGQVLATAGHTQVVVASDPGAADAGAAVRKGLSETGCAVIDVGCVPAPFLVTALRWAGGAGVLAGRHGLRVYRGPLRTGPGEHETAASLFAAAGTATISQPAGRHGSAQVWPLYRDALLGALRARALPDRVLVAPAGEPAVAAFIELAGDLGCRAKACGPAGLAGDCARLGLPGLMLGSRGEHLAAFDETGRPVSPELFQVCLWRALSVAATSPQVPVEVSASQLLVDEVKRLGGRPVFHRCSCGAVRSTHLRLNLPLAGTACGAFFWGEHLWSHPDAIYTGLRFLSSLRRPLAREVDEAGHYCATPLTRLRAASPAVAAGAARLVADRFRGEAALVEADGVRILFRRGWALVRPSHSGRALAVRAEAGCREDLDKILQAVRAVLGGVAGLEPWPH
ncbi:MAG: hypothetical protein AB1492_04420 [Bacillota bacterium]